MSILPPEVRAGYVYDRVLRAIGDRPYDEDRLPDGIPAQGRVIFRPKTAVKQLVSKGRGVTVTREPVTCNIHQGENQPDDPDPEKGGLLIDEAGHVGGVWLVVGEWTAEYHMEDRYSNIPNEEIIVTEEHTEDNPLDVALASELTPTPTQKFVVNEQIYVDSKNYRDEALEFRNDAQEAFEKFTWPVHVQDTPPEDTRVIWVNPDEPAGTASDYARRAEEMYEASKALGITVDTSVGTRVFVGDTMIYGDTGWRDVLTWDAEGNFTSGDPGLFVGWEPRLDSDFGGAYSVRRINETIYYRMTNVRSTGESGSRVGTISGFRPGSNDYVVTQSYGSGAAVNGSREVRVQIGANWMYMGNEGLNTNLSYGMTWQFITSLNWPTSLPGTPA